MSAFITKRLCVNFKDCSNLVWKMKSGDRNTEVAFWERNTENLLDSIFFHLKIS